MRADRASPLLRRRSATPGPAGWGGTTRPDAAPTQAGLRCVGADRPSTHRTVDGRTAGRAARAADAGGSPGAFGGAQLRCERARPRHGVEEARLQKRDGGYYWARVRGERRSSGAKSRLSEAAKSLEISLGRGAVEGPAKQQRSPSRREPFADRWCAMRPHSCGGCDGSGAAASAGCRRGRPRLDGRRQGSQGLQSHLGDTREGWTGGKRTRTSRSASGAGGDAGSATRDRRRRLRTNAQAAGLEVDAAAQRDRGMP